MTRKLPARLQKHWHAPTGQWRLQMGDKVFYLGADEGTAEQSRLKILVEMLNSLKRNLLPPEG